MTYENQKPIGEHRRKEQIKHKDERKKATYLIGAIILILIVSFFFYRKEERQAEAKAYKPNTYYVEMGQEIKHITAEVTAYSEFDSCHYPNCVMASGKRAYVGAIACPRNIPLGTKVVIDGAEYTCEDRTAKYLDGRYDIFTGYRQEAYDKALKFGVQVKSITINL